MSGHVRVRRVARAFGTHHVLRDLDLTVEPGEFVALIGRSGSGKSTLLRIVAGLDRPDAGRVEVPDRIAVAFQEARLLPWRRVARNVGLGLPRPGRDEAVARTLSEVGLEHRAHAWPLTLSGGEAQRASLARALVREPRLLLLDEPFSALDALTRLTMHALVSDLHRRHRWSALMVTHDVGEAVRLASRVVVLADGRVAGEVRTPGADDAAGDVLTRRAHAEQRLLELLGLDADARSAARTTR